MLALCCVVYRTRARGYGGHSGFKVQHLNLQVRSCATFGLKNPRSLAGRPRVPGSRALIAAPTRPALGILLLYPAPQTRCPAHLKICTLTLKSPKSLAGLPRRSRQRSAHCRPPSTSARNLLYPAPKTRYPAHLTIPYPHLPSPWNPSNLRSHLRLHLRFEIPCRPAPRSL